MREQNVALFPLFCLGLDLHFDRVMVENNGLNDRGQIDQKPTQQR